MHPVARLGLRQRGGEGERRWGGVKQRRGKRTDEKLKRWEGETTKKEGENPCDTRNETVLVSDGI